MLSETILMKLINTPTDLNSKITELNNKLANIESKSKASFQGNKEVTNNARSCNSRKN